MVKVMGSNSGYLLKSLVLHCKIFQKFSVWKKENVSAIASAIINISKLLSKPYSIRPAVSRQLTIHPLFYYLLITSYDLLANGILHNCGPYWFLFTFFAFKTRNFCIHFPCTSGSYLGLLNCGC